jgi:hypothetical protein
MGKETKDKVQAYYVAKIAEGLIQVPEGWEISGQPLFLETLIVFPVEKK